MAGPTNEAKGRALSESDWALLKELKEFVRSHGEAYLSDKNITSVGIGTKVKDGKEELAVLFTVRKKASSDNELEALETTPIPKSVTVAGHEIATDVIERSYEAGYRLVAEAETVKDERKKRLAVVVPGVSVGHPATTAGTAGAIVYDIQTGSPCVLSNWHVLHTPSGKLGDPMLQPGPYDDNRADQNRAGTLLRSHLGRAGDCAIARVEDREFDPTVLDLNVRVSQLARPDLSDRVVKSGRTTDVTYGIVRRVETTAKINYGGAIGDQLVGGFEIGPDGEHKAPGGQISRGGDSGSAWLAIGQDGKPTDIMVGLHFGGEGAGDPDDHALACYAPAVFEKLEISPTEPQASALAVDEPEYVSTGFDESFLSKRVHFPTLTQAVRGDAVKLGNSHLIRYTHFTVCLSKSRRMPRVVAWNIDGGRIKQLMRGDNFRFDPRISEDFQIGNDVYSLNKNKLDRGHIARRADLVWGPKAEAGQANSDSFYFTNISPQHQAFNQSRRHGLWGELENAIFEDVDVENLHVSVMGGPILEHDDPEYDTIKIPRSFWKLIAYVDSADGAFKVRAFVLSQNDLLNDIEALELDEFRVWQVSVADLQMRTKLRFEGLLQADTAVPEAEAEAVPRRYVREIRNREEVMG